MILAFSLKLKDGFWVVFCYTVHGSHMTVHGSHMLHVSDSMITSLVLCRTFSFPSQHHLSINTSRIFPLKKHPKCAQIPTFLFPMKRSMSQFISFHFPQDENDGNDVGRVITYPFMISAVIMFLCRFPIHEKSSWGFL